MSNTSSSKITSMDEALDAARFVLREIGRINSLSVEQRMERIRADWREGISFLSGHPEFALLECGREALERIHDLTDYLLHSNSIVAESASHDTVRRTFEKHFIERYVKRRRPLDKSTLSSVIQKAANDVAAQVRPRTFAIPCICGNGRSPITFQLVPLSLFFPRLFSRDLKMPYLRPTGKSRRLRDSWRKRQGGLR